MLNKYLLTLACLLGLAPLHAAETVTIEHGGITLNASLEQSGNWPAGPVMLMTHGTLAHAGMEIMATLQGLLADNDISSLAINLSLGIDNRPQAMYDCPTPHNHKHTDSLDEIGAWLDWLKKGGTGKVVLLGHSRGGNQVAWFAAERDDPAVSAVVMVAAATWSADYNAKDYRKRYGTELGPLFARARQMVEQGKGDELISDIGFIYCADTSATAASIANYYAADERNDTPTLLPKIKKPKLVVEGSEDKVYDNSIEKFQARADAGQAELLVIDGSDHFFRDLYADELVEAVVEFIEE
ncbi:MAG: alpha/beta hydrolase [Pseudomonadota bacterium]